MNYVKFLTIGVLICLLYTVGAAQSAVQIHGKLHVNKGKIMNQHQSVAQLRGISFSWSIWGGRKYYRPEVVDWLIDDFKVNIIRVSMAVEPEGGYLAAPEEQFELITKVVDRAIERGIYVLIDWHDHHAHHNIVKAKDFFRRVAQRYQESPQVIYEIWNEPEQVTWQVVKDYAVSLIRTIRTYDKENMIIVGSPNWDQDVDTVANDPITGFENIAYSFHFYASDPYHQDRLRERAELAIARQLPLFVTEWGVGESNGDGAFDRQKTAIWLDWMEKNQLSWVNWNLTDKKETTALLNPYAAVYGKWKRENLTPAGRFIRKKLRKLNR